MNRYACSNSQNGRRFTTAFIAEYDPAVASLDLRQCRTQQSDPAPPDRRRSNDWKRAGCRWASWKMPPTSRATVTLQSGDWLAIFTDGVIEAENNSQQEYGEERLITMLHAGVMLTPAMLLNSI